MDLILAKSKFGLQGAANGYQWNLIEGIEENLGEPIDILNSIPIGSYPNAYKQLILSSKNWSHALGARDKNVGFVNLPIIKQIIRYISFRQEIVKWCKEHKDQDLFLITYSMYFPYLMAIKSAKKKVKQIHTCIIVPDLPNAFGYDKGVSLIKYLRKKMEKLQYQYTKRADCHIILTKEMRTPLGLSDKSSTIVEGICNPGFPKEEQRQLEHKVILYSGALNQRFGLDKLVAAFQEIKENDIELWICGIGDYQEEIKKISLYDSRIKYFGYVTPQKLHHMQMQASVLINPRANEEEYTKYSFPSKTIEYMACAKPVLMFKLDGIPDEYDPFLLYIKENTTLSMKEAMVFVLSMSREELIKRGNAAREFVVEYKCKYAQGKKVLNMFYQILDQKPGSLISKGDNQEKKNTILQINITCGYGSTGKIVVDLHNQLIEQGFHSRIAYAAYSSRIKESFRIETVFQNYLRRGCNRYLGRKYVHSSLGTYRLIRKIKRIHPDLIHLHNIQQNSVHFPMLLQFLSKYQVPVVYTLHDCWPFTGGCYHFTELNCDGYRMGCPNNDCKLPKEERYLCNKSPEQNYDEKKRALWNIKQIRLICVSNWLKSCAMQSFMKDMPMEVIHNGIDLNLFKPVNSNKRAEYHILEEEFIILGVANHWDNKKGLDLFLSLSNYLQPPYRIVLIGSMVDLRNYERIITIDRTADVRELVAWYSCADVLLNGSKEETFGLVSAEAMACGTPVISYNSTACAEIMGEETGILLETDQYEELLNAILNIRKCGKRNYSNHCINHIRTNFSKEASLRKYLEVYQEMLVRSTDKF